MRTGAAPLTESEEPSASGVRAGVRRLGADERAPRRRALCRVGARTWLRFRCMRQGAAYRRRGPGETGWLGRFAPDVFAALGGVALSLAMAGILTSRTGPQGGIPGSWGGCSRLGAGQAALQAGVLGQALPPAAPRGRRGFHLDGPSPGTAPALLPGRCDRPPGVPVLWGCGVGRRPRTGDELFNSDQRRRRPAEHPSTSDELLHAKMGTGPLRAEQDEEFDRAAVGAAKPVGQGRVELGRLTG